MARPSNGVGTICIQEFIKTYQTLIVGAVGFAGVITTLLVNAWLDRRRHTRQIDHDRKTLRAALRAELANIRDTYQDRIEMLADSISGQGAWIPMDAMTDIYSRLLDRIGLLSEAEISLVMRAYLLAQQMPGRLTLLEIGTSGPPLRDEVPGHIFITSRSIATAKQLHEV